MAGTRPKKKAGQPGPTITRQFSVLVEDLRSQFKVFGEALQGSREEVAAGFQQVDRRLHVLERDVSVVKGDVSILKGDMALVKTAVLEHSRDLKELRATSLEHTRELKEVKSDLAEVRMAVDRLTVKVDQKVDRAEVAAIVEEVVARPRSH
jgi:chromosome segregation ATPase